MEHEITGPRTPRRHFEPEPPQHQHKNIASPKVFLALSKKKYALPVGEKYLSLGREPKNYLESQNTRT